MKNSQNFRCACSETPNSAGVAPRAMRAGIEFPTLAADDGQSVFHGASIEGLRQQLKDIMNCFFLLS